MYYIIIDGDADFFPFFVSLLYIKLVRINTLYTH